MLPTKINRQTDNQELLKMRTEVMNNLFFISSLVYKAVYGFICIVLECLVVEIVKNSRLVYNRAG